MTSVGTQSLSVLATTRCRTASVMQRPKTALVMSVTSTPLALPQQRYPRAGRMSGEWAGDANSR